jgi:alpha-N-arabinofuranosidase
MVFQRRVLVTGMALWLAACAGTGGTDNIPGSAAIFERFSYAGRAQESATPAATQYRNPILSGYYPDPSVLRVGSDYYLVNSSFTNFPGLPLFHSRDLVNWTQVANVIDRPSQFSFKGLRSSRGIYAPDISHRDGRFYVVTTCVDCGGNVVMTATNPKGPWSDPIKLRSGGIDPSLFWDKDGKVYLVGNDAPAEKPRYDGHRAIWVQEFDPAALAVKGDRTLLVNGGVDIAARPIWIEGPHIFRRGQYYYLIAAEGGTGDNHSQVVFRSTSVRGPFLPYERNPILSQRTLDPTRPNPVTSAGHAKFVQTADGAWWASFLATRPYGDGLYNIGRETFLLPVSWKDDWPVVLEDGKPIPFVAPRPALPAQPRPALPFSGDFAYTDEFTGARLSDQWIGVRTPAAPFHRLANGRLVLEPAGQLGDLDSTPAFIARRQQHHIARVATSLRFRPIQEGDRAGLVAYQSDASHLFYGLARLGQRNVLALTVRDKAASDRLLASVPLDSEALDLQIEADGGRMRFSYTAGGVTRVLRADVDASFLSTAKAGGFTGTIIGPYVWRAGTGAGRGLRPRD